MSNRELVPDDEGRLVFKSEELDDIGMEVNALQADLKEIAESIRTLNDTLRHLVTQQMLQREAQAAIAAAILIDPQQGCAIPALKYRADLLTKAFGV